MPVGAASAPGGSFGPDGGGRTVVLVGNPNAGKSTLFNALTGLRQRVANYPGVTVERKSARLELPGGRVCELLDTPGTYSLVPRSPDEQVVCEVLRGLRDDTPRPDVIVAVVDATNLARNLYLVSQVLELGVPVVVVLTMVDVASRQGVRPDAEKLSKALGVSVVEVEGHRKRGIGDLKHAIERAAESNAGTPVPPALPWPTGFAEARSGLAAQLAELGETAGAGGGQLAERLLIGDPSPDVQGVLARPEVQSALEDARERLRGLGIEPVQADVEAHYGWIDRVVAEVIPARTVPVSLTVSAGRGRAYGPTLSDRLDRVLIHRVGGLVVFAVVMLALFVSIFVLADPLMSATEDAVGVAGGWVAGWLPEGPIGDLWTDGIVAGVGAVLVFVPQIAVMFLFLSVLEDSGYLARGAFLMDRLLSRFGLSGKSFIPLMSSFACAIPGIMATRVIEHPRQRLATIFVAPFMSCSARLPVYGLLIGAFFGGASVIARGGLLFGLYALGVLAAVGTAWAFTRGKRVDADTVFILELPPYRLPRPAQVARHVWRSTREFVTKAGTTIFCLSVVLWGLTYYPRLSPDVVTRLEQEGATAEQVAAEQMARSAAGRFGRAIEPVISPLGYDWKIGVGMVGAFAAREVFVSTLGIVYGVGNADDEPTGLREAMRADRRADGSAVWTPAVGVSLLVWFVLAMQCVSTLAIARRETGGWRYPIRMLVYMNVLAYVASLATYQVLHYWGW